jgi:hypothetical protein
LQAVKAKNRARIAVEIWIVVWMGFIINEEFNVLNKAKNNLIFYLLINAEFSIDIEASFVF